MEDRYSKNLIFSEEEQEALGQKAVFVAGLGGLGGYCAEMLARLGVGRLIVCDGDYFCTSNLNRQLLASEENLGRSKARECRKRIRAVNSQVQAEALEGFITALNGREMLLRYGKIDLAIDALDTPGDKLLLEALCRELDIPMIHGAVSGWQGQVCAVMPGSEVLREIYSGESLEEDLGTPSFTPAVAAGLQAAEAAKVLLNREEIEEGRIIFFDLLSGSFEKLMIKGGGHHDG